MTVKREHPPICDIVSASLMMSGNLASGESFIECSAEGSADIFGEMPLS